MKKTALVICPGRGTYNKDELGYLRRHHPDQKDFIAAVDSYRREHNQTPVTDLDNREKYSLAEHTRGDNASPLIYTCAYADFMAIDRDKFDIVAVTGNSMGWYIALACGSAASPENALHIINTMGTLMHERLTGGQLLHTLVDENWRAIPGRREYFMSLINTIPDLHVSIELGGMMVFGGTKEALDNLEKELKPEQGKFPMRLANHAAFHTPLLKPISDHARTILHDDLFQHPALPLIDGRGHIWTPHATNAHEIWDYTFGHQVHTHYDFTHAVQVGVKEFAPDAVIILGPGGTLGGAVAQSLIGINWQDMAAKEDFITRQKSAPYILSMGMDEQRNLATG